MLALLALLACSDKETVTPPDDSVIDSEGPPRCGTALSELPEGLTELSHDDGAGVYTIADFNWQPDGSTQVAELPLWEVARFDLEHPARVYGFSIQYGALSAEDGEISAGLFADFGHNGFDFWRFDPLWEGTRCREELAEGSRVIYALETPIELSQPGLLYAGHYRESGDEAVMLDATGDDDCAVFTNCHSALNLPELTSTVSGGAQYIFWNGLSSSLANDYLIRLYVEYTDDLSPEERFFQDESSDLAVSSRQAWGDYNNDGWDDLFTPGPKLYENNGDGTFTDRTAEAGLSGVSASGGVWGDYDNDGCLDLFVFTESYTSGEALLHSDCDGSFTDRTAEAGISDVQAYNLCNNDASRDRSPTAAAAWWDIDNDGLLDLYLANFICWDEYSYYKNTPLHNNGDGTFSDWTGENGFDSSTMASRGAAPVDHDQDGDIDLFVNNYVLQRNLFYDNQGDGTVNEVGEAVNLDGQRDFSTGYYGHTIGAAWGDLDNDGDLDLVSANLAHPRFWDFSNKTQILLQGDDGHFDDNSGAWDDPWPDNGLRYQETYSVPTLADFDADGNLDLVMSAVYDGRPTDFYFGLGDGTFTLDSYHAGIPVENGWGMAAADYDNDGDVDLAASGKLLRNDLDGGHWLQVRALGDVASNRSAYGATVRVEAGGRTRVSFVSGGNGQGDQDSATLVFGLGDTTAIDAIEVDFPGGGTVRYAGPFTADQRLWLSESGGVHAGWSPP